MAIKALKSIERSLKIKAFLVKPLVVVLSGIVLLGLGFTAAMLSPLALPLVALVIAIRIAGIALSCLGLCMSAIALEDFKHLSQLSIKYKQDADLAHKLLGFCKILQTNRLF
ncbi:MAG: hypothetical protein HWD61_02740 [Parachlamydiaceae bacterium]|nr:MAG: hypothetical protein HWD61_02740 [Parachlamydiaceae bacterium]